MLLGILVSSVFSVPALAHGDAQNLRSLFSPWDDIEGAIIATISKARQEVLVQAYLLTSRPIAKALLAAHGRGVDVQVLADGAMAVRTGTEQLQVLSRAGIPVWLESRYAAAHNKVVLVDAAGPRPVLITGSYNFTWSAQARNAENVLIVTGNGDISRRYAENWRRHRAEATAYQETGTTEPRTVDAR